VERGIIENAGAYVEALELSPDQAISLDWFGPDMAKEIMNIQAEWFTKAVAYLNRTEDWDLMMMHFHEPDGINHQELGKLDPSMGAEVNLRADAFLGDTISLLSKMAAKIAQECDDGNTFVIVVSDHGNLPLTKIVNVQGVMMREGWTSYAKDEKPGRWSLDPGHSVAAFENSGVWINLKGREMNGLVEPGAEYENLRTKIINRLQKVTDPETGNPVFSIVAKREDLAELGIWGERTEDIFAFSKPYYMAWSGPKSMTKNVPEELMNSYRDSREVIPLATAIDAGYYDRSLSADHWGLPTGTVGYASNRASFILYGPGVVQGGRAARINLVDVAATTSYLLGIRPPEQCEGRIVWQALAK
jgi:predicted AlkP superfamily phosphohydrolase/phosphomutase